MKCLFVATVAWQLSTAGSWRNRALPRSVGWSVAMSASGNSSAFTKFVCPSFKKRLVPRGDLARRLPLTDRLANMNLDIPRERIDSCSLSSVDSWQKCPWRFAEGGEGGGAMLEGGTLAGDHGKQPAGHAVASQSQPFTVAFTRPRRLEIPSSSTRPPVCCQMH